MGHPAQLLARLEVDIVQVYLGTGHSIRKFNAFASAASAFRYDIIRL